jgi:RNA polymerase sigma-70 factor (ECF subfamily)
VEPEFFATGAMHASPVRREPAAPDEQAQSREERRLIEEAVARLPRLYREAYVLSELEELPNTEIGARLGLSLPAVKSRIHRARLLLRRALAPTLNRPNSDRPPNRGASSTNPELDA